MIPFPMFNPGMMAQFAQQQYPVKKTKSPRQLARAQLRSELYRKRQLEKQQSLNHVEKKRQVNSSSNAAATSVKRFVDKETQTDSVLVLPVPLSDINAKVLKEDKKLSKLAYLKRIKKESAEKILVSSETNEITNNYNSPGAQAGTSGNSKKHQAVDTSEAMDTTSDMEDELLK